MGISLAELGKRFSASEVSRWQLYEEVEPFGSRLIDEHFARLELAHAGEGADIKQFRLMHAQPVRQSAEVMIHNLKGAR